MVSLLRRGFLFSFLDVFSFSKHLQAITSGCLVEWWTVSGKKWSTPDERSVLHFSCSTFCSPPPLLPYTPTASLLLYTCRGSKAERVSLERGWRRRRRILLFCQKLFLSLFLSICEWERPRGTELSGEFSWDTAAAFALAQYTLQFSNVNLHIKWNKILKLCKIAHLMNFFAGLVLHIQPVPHDNFEICRNSCYLIQR